MIKFRPLKAEEIEIRIDRVSAKGAWLLLYKNARVDMAILDEVVGVMNWQRKHVVINDNLFCTISIWDEDKKQWVEKQDVGVESFSAKEKGESSDSFKRAGTCWGIGRELYNAPKIFVVCKTKPKDGNKFELDDRYLFDGSYVSYVSHDERDEIKELALSDKKGNVIWSNMGKSSAPLDPTEPTEDGLDINGRISKIHKQALLQRIEKIGFTEKKICNNYGIKTLDDMTIIQLANCNEQLAKIEDKRRKQAEQGEI